MTTLYACLGSGNCFKPWLLSHQLGTPLKVKLIDVLAGEQKSPEFLAINGLGVVPYLVTDDGLGLGESNAMLWYLADGSDFLPASAQERAETLQWMFFEQSKLVPFISPARFFTTILPEQKEARAGDISNWQACADPHLHQLDAHLENRTFMLASGYSVCDIAIFGYVHVIEEAGLNLDDYPAIKRWIDDVSQFHGFRPLTELGQLQKQAA